MSNRLAAATSPYLLQHKDNPVDWYEWGEDAFAAARERDVPILLSVGYSACHWCHVMAHESFEDPATAADMNRLFVNVKVDREERPDVDSVYMEAVQAMTRSGGWPMTVWMTPEGEPFYAGTYFPDTDRHGMPAFRRVLVAIGDAWANRRDELLEQSAKLTEAISRPIPQAAQLPGADVLEEAYQVVLGSFDAINGGFGGAPKFPQQPVLEFLLRIRDEPWATRADEMVETTLLEMANGGIHDHVGGGFARYSVDEHWLVPHFEKMLYDNAQLARIYLWAGVELDNSRFLDVCRSTLDYLVSYLRHPGGGFYSAEDADSEGVEGRFYVWTVGEMEEALGAEAAEAARYFGASQRGNFEGSNVLHRPTGEPWNDRVEAIRIRLLQAREDRVRPALDDKVIAAWNGLAVRALAEAGAVLAEDRYLQAARDAAGFVLENLAHEGVLRRSWRNERTSVPGFLDDHASVSVGLFALYAATGEIEWFERAVALVGGLTSFVNPDGGYFSTPDGGDVLVKRPVDMTDNPLPSGGALAAEALLLASLYTGDSSYREGSEAALRAAGLLMDRFPMMVAHHLSVLHSLHRGTRELAIVGPNWRQLAQAYWRRFRPHVALAGSVAESNEPALLAGRGGENTKAFVCRGFVCDLPVTNGEDLAALLG